ncbi:MAG: thioredoxin family protein [Candidatus Cloacimonetes bacterium]|nr:thioredoxin family protein [Candidatus Cloacimonadota bacterium]
MKRILMFALLLLLFVPACSKEKDSKNTTGSYIVEKYQLEWYTNLEKALEIAKIENKSVLINFTGSDWCGWCFKIRDEILVKEEFREFAKESLILVELDFPKKIKQSDETKAYNRKIMTRFNIRGFPSIVILDADGNELSGKNDRGQIVDKTGYQYGGAGNYVKHIKTFIEK